MRPFLLRAARALLLFLGGALEVEGQQAFQDFGVGETGRPAIGVGDSGVERGVEVGEPSGALVVEVGQGAFFQIGV